MINISLRNNGVTLSIKYETEKFDIDSSFPFNKKDFENRVLICSGQNIGEMISHDQMSKMLKDSKADLWMLQIIKDRCLFYKSFGDDCAMTYMMSFEHFCKNGFQV